VTAHPIKNKADLFANSLIMLSETIERYDMFADQMEMVNNPRAAEIFSWLSAKQTERINTVRALSKDQDLPHIPPWNYHWDDAINVDANGYVSAHYMMTPYHTLKFAMQVEISAADFFNHIEQNTELPELKKLADSFAAEALSFYKTLENELEKHSPPEEGWDDDPDEPNLLE